MLHVSANEDTMHFVFFTNKKESKHAYIMAETRCIEFGKSFTRIILHLWHSSGIFAALSLVVVKSFPFCS